MGCIPLSGTPGLQCPKGDVHRDQRDPGGFRKPRLLFSTIFFLPFHTFEMDSMNKTSVNYFSVK